MSAPATPPTSITSWISPSEASEWTGPGAGVFQPYQPSLTDTPGSESPRPAPAQPRTAARAAHQSRIDRYGHASGVSTWLGDEAPTVTFTISGIWLEYCGAASASQKKIGRTPHASANLGQALAGDRRVLVVQVRAGASAASAPELKTPKHDDATRRRRGGTSWPPRSGRAGCTGQQPVDHITETGADRCDQRANRLG